MQPRLTCFGIIIFLPPKPQRIETMASDGALFVDVTFAAGGSDSRTAKECQTVALCKTAINYCGVEAMAHLTSMTMSEATVNEQLDLMVAAGVRNILALRGDPPRGSVRWEPAPDAPFRYGVDLVRHIRQRHGDHFGIAVAGYPAGHPDSGADSPEAYALDIKYLKEKVDAGADFVVTQLFFEVDTFFKFLADCRAAGITVPIVPGVMPLQTYASLRNLAKLSGLPVPAALSAEVEPIKDNDTAIAELGVAKGVDMCRRLLAHPDVHGIHFYTLNREVATRRIVEALELDLHSGDRQPLPWKTVASGRARAQGESVRPIFWRHKPKSYALRTAEWDDFPNGRWGSLDAPSFGDLDGYHLFTPHLSKAKRAGLVKAWGEPTSLAQVSRVFCDFLLGTVPHLPWQMEAASDETYDIESELMMLNAAGYLTINSQPAVNGMPSTDGVYGWGPAGGFVYQKAYVEFFCSQAEFDALAKMAQRFPAISWMAARTGPDAELLSNLPGDQLTVATAVTWGVFPAREVVQPTVVDSRAFMIWREEAFGMWLTSWRALFSEEKNAPAWNFLTSVHDTFYLVTLVDEDFQKPTLWKLFAQIVAQCALHQ